MKTGVSLLCFVLYSTIFFLVKGLGFYVWLFLSLAFSKRSLWVLVLAFVVVAWDGETTGFGLV